MTTSSDTPQLSQEEINALLIAYGITPTEHVPSSPEPDPADPAVRAAMAAQEKAAKSGKPISQFITDSTDRIGQLFARLTQLRDVLATVNPQQAEAKDIKDSLKVELRRLDPASRKIQLWCAGARHGYEVRCSQKTAVDLKRMKIQFPDAYAACVTETDQWGLFEIRSTDD